MPKLPTHRQYITVVGFYHEDTGLVQILWPDLTAESLAAALPKAERVYTFNGNNFDISVIRNQLGLDLLDYYKSRDLMYDCWKQGLKGGLKKVEQVLGIQREQPPLSNYEIQRCWTRWKHHDAKLALEMLLKYNEDDVMNLLELRRKLRV